MNPVILQRTLTFSNSKRFQHTLHFFFLVIFGSCVPCEFAKDAKRFVVRYCMSILDLQ